MTITVRTKQYFVLALLLAGAAFAAAGYLFIQVRQQGQALESNLAIITENNAKAATFARIERQINESSDERATIASAFLPSGAAGPDFLTKLEMWGAAYGLEIEVLDLGEVPSVMATGKTEVMVKFTFSGEQRTVLQFTKLLESLPYHSRLESLTINESTTTGENTAEVDLRITVYPAS